MSAYTLSRYMTAHKAHRCWNCGREIMLGARYLQWRSAVASTQYVCWPCSVQLTTIGTPLFYCRAVEDCLRLRASDTHPVGT